MEVIMMDVAKLTVKGQVTIPVEIRRKLGLKEGDKVLFVEQGDNVVLMNSNRLAFKQFQQGMAGAAEQAGWTSEQDVIDAVNQVRQEMWEGRNADNV